MKAINDAHSGTQGGRTKLDPLRLHPKNPRYLEFRGRPVVLITSGEHYGSIINLDFDFKTYLGELHRWGFNLTRLFSGVYREPAFWIGDEMVTGTESVPSRITMPPNHPLAPLPGRFLAPWARSDTPGYADGGAKFDLTRWDPAYFARLQDFVSEAERLGIVVEYTFYHSFIGLAQWALSPLNADNNVNGLGQVGFRDATASESGLWEVQEALVRKVATVLSPFDNVYYELIGEPYLEPVRPEWQARMISALAEIEASLGRPHLIAKNLPSVLGTGVDVEPAVSILNFHNAAPSDVRANLDAGCALGFDETVFLGTDDAPHRTGGWDFLMSGGAIFSNTDYSFTTRDPAGRHAPPALNRVPGSWSDSASMGGGPVLRSQLAFLLRFFDRLPLVEMAPAPNVIAEGPRLGSARVLARSGLVYAAYLNSLGADVHTENIRLRVETGRYVVQWFDPVTGREADEREVSTEGEISLRSPAFTDDAVVLLTRSATAT